MGAERSLLREPVPEPQTRSVYDDVAQCLTMEVAQMSERGEHVEAAELYKALLDQVKNEAHERVLAQARAWKWFTGLLGALVVGMIPLVISGLIELGAYKSAVEHLEEQVTYQQQRLDHLFELQQQRPER